MASCIPEPLRVTQVLDSRFPHGYSAQCVDTRRGFREVRLPESQQGSNRGFPLLRGKTELAPSAPRTRAAAVLRMKQIALDNQSRTIRRLRVKLATERRGMKSKKRHTRESHLECHHKWQARIQVVEDSLQAQHLIIEALVEEKDSLLQIIQGLKEAIGAPAPFDDEWEEEPEENPEEEEIEEISVGEGEIVDE
ncbi:F-box protein [Dorcoceras hygrometricum]|uniref:F-box protein n=1 Tax=Dorcoceras hygrometricum TaxID=472368 RepID=A0A2Z7CES4_9LAMI|nr:F-box protein [Dorcoceras hygrometricum]